MNLKRIFYRTAGVVILLFLIGVAYLSTFGFPDQMTDRIIKRINLGAFHWETDGIKLELFNGFALDNVRVYRKKVLGPPAIEAEKVVAVINPLSLITGKSVCQEIRIHNGEVRPFLATAPTASKETGTAGSGHLRVVGDNCRIMGVTFETLSCEIQQQGLITRLTALKASLKDRNMRGTCDAEVRYDGATSFLDIQLLTQLDPHLLLPAIREWQAPFTEKLVQRFNFPGLPPKCDLHLTRLGGTNGFFSINGQFWIQECSYLGVDALRADGGVALTFSDTNSIVTINPLLIVRREGTATGGFSVDTVNSNVQFDGVSSISPKALLHMASVFTNNEMDVFRFNGPLKMTAKGVVNYGDLNKTDFAGKADARNVGLGPIDAETCSLDMRMTGLTYAVTNLVAKAYGGDLTGSAAFVLPSESYTNTRYAITCRVKNADFAKMVRKSKEHGEEYKGQLSALVKVEGLMGTGNANTAQGTGEVAIKDGRVFMLPVFGGLSHIMTKIIPGLDFVLRQTDAKAEFTIADGRLHSDAVQIEGDILSLKGNGDYHLDGKVDFDVELTFLKSYTLGAKLLRIPTYLISKLFELRLHGTFDNPHWYPVNFSKDILEKIGLGDKKDS
jgi:hypothetical protein